MSNAFEGRIAEKMYDLDPDCDDDGLDQLRRAAMEALLEGADEDDPFTAYLRNRLALFNLPESKQ